MWCQYPTGKLKKRLLSENILENKCDECGISEWNGKGISLQLDHIDGNSHNHVLNNLRLLCPNCHAEIHANIKSLKPSMV